MYSAIRLLQFLFAARERSYRSQVQQPLISIGILECHHRRRLVEPPILYLDGAIAGVYREQAYTSRYAITNALHVATSRTVIRSHEDRPF
jgi:hypothetical protein